MSAYRQVPYGMPKGRFIWEFDPNIPLLGIMIFLFLLSYVFFSLSGHWVFLKIFVPIDLILILISGLRRRWVDPNPSTITWLDHPPPTK